MAEERLRRNLDTALDPGPEFPGRLWLSRTMAALERDAEHAGGSGHRPPIGWSWWGALRPGRKVAAVIALIVMVIASTAAFVALRVAITQNTPASWPPHPIARSSSAGEGGYGTSVAMVTANVGWQVKLRGNEGWEARSEILRTTDAGAHWSVMSMPANLQPDQPGAFYVLDDQHIWFTQTTRIGGRVQIFTISTTNGGSEWSQGASVEVGSLDLPAQQGAAGLSLYFLDSRNGWMLVQPLYAYEYDSGPGVQTAHLYRTSDGGQTWFETAHVDLGLPATQVCSPGDQCTTRVGSHCWWSGMAFSSILDGFLTQEGPCLESGNRADGLLVTHDGGASWSPAPNPSCTCSSLISVGEPPLVLDQRQVVVADLKSSDAGRTWVAWPPSEPPLFTSTPRTDFIDLSHGWILDGLEGLWRTADGGQHWSHINSSLPFDDAALQFVDPQHGFAIAATQMWKTNDAGHTWTLAGPVL